MPSMIFVHILLKLVVRLTSSGLRYEIVIGTEKSLRIGTKDGRGQGLSSNSTGESMNYSVMEFFILKELGKPKSLIKFVKDRLGHDLRYSLNCEKIKKLSWKPETSFEEGIKVTIEWYVKNRW